MAGFVVACVVGALALLPRFPDYEAVFSGRYLWAEDGPVLLAQAQSLGLRSLWEPYAGYLLLYQRLVALGANLLELSQRPAVYIGGWFAGYLFMIGVVTVAARRHSVKWLSIFVLVGLIAFQPSGGEALFNLTNVQWSLGAALAILLIVGLDTKRPSGPLLGVTVFVMALTGPFSILLSPFVILVACLRKDWSQHRMAYLPAFVGGGVQLLFVLSSGRAGNMPFNQSPWDFVVAFEQMAFFGARSHKAFLVALIFWIVLFWSVRTVEQQRVRISVLLLSFLTILVLAVLYSVRVSPMSAVSLGGGNRFTWIPYTILFFLAFLLARGSLGSRLLLMASMGFVCYGNFQKVDFHDFHFDSLAKLANHKPVDIPLNPGFIVFRAFPAVEVPDAELPRAAFDFRRSLQTTMEKRGDMAFVSEQGDPSITFNQPIRCKGATDIVIEFDLTRDTDGPLQLFWNRFPGFEDKQSQRRWYDVGRVHVEMGFPTRGDETYIRLDPMDGPGAVTVHNMQAYCLH